MATKVKEGMTDAATFLTQFTKDLIAHPMERQQMIAGWAKHLEARDQANRAAVLHLADKFVEDNPEAKINSSGWRELAETAAGILKVAV